MDISKHLPYLYQVLEDRTHIIGEIYKITNLANGKYYVGQAVSHRLNCGKYKPFGYSRRFKDHISEAINNTKKKQCSYLNNAIRKYGVENFKVELITRCTYDELNDLEIKYIADVGTLFPNGYNLDKGGKQKTSLFITREKIMTSIQNIYLDSKLSKYDNIKIKVKLEDVDKYIREYKSRGEVYFVLIIDDVKSIFVGKYMSKEDLYKRVIDFLKLLIDKQSATSSNCGNTL
jgi:hypothetical protein